MDAAAKSMWGTASLRKRVVAIQGLGSVGAKLANILLGGRHLILSEIDPERLQQAAVLYGDARFKRRLYFCPLRHPCSDALWGDLFLLNNSAHEVQSRCRSCQQSAF